MTHTDTAFEEIVDLLAFQSVHEGFPEERRKLATVCIANGIEPRDVQTLVDWQERTRVKHRQAALATLLANPKKALEVLADIRFVSEKRSQTTDVRHNAKPESPADWRDGDLARRVYALVSVEGKSIDCACREWGLTRERAESLLAMGLELRHPGIGRREKDTDEAAEERRKKWEQFCRDHKKQRSEERAAHVPRPQMPLPTSIEEFKKWVQS